MKITQIVAVSLVGLLALWYVAALKAPVLIVTPSRPPAPKANGFPGLQAAAAKIVRADDVMDATSTHPPRPWTTAQKRDLVLANSRVLQDAHAALKLPYYQPNTMLSVNDTLLITAKPFRHLTRALTLAGDAAWTDGKQTEATGYYLDAVTLGRRVPNRGGLLQALSGMACETIGRARLWRHIEGMNVATATLCLTRLNPLEAERVHFSTTLAEEKYSLQSMAQEVMTHPERIRTTDEGDDGDKNDSPVSYGDLVPPRYVMDTMGSHMDKLIAQSKRPYIEGNAEIPCPRELYTMILAPITTGARTKYVANDAGNALLRTALALRVHRLQTSVYPATLDKLVAAKLLPAVPTDPFALPGTALHYRPAPNNKYVLYSIGPDGVDDNNGRGIVGKSTSGAVIRHANGDSKGDMLAGWYTY